MNSLVAPEHAEGRSPANLRMEHAMLQAAHISDGSVAMDVSDVSAKPWKVARGQQASK